MSLGCGEGSRFSNAAASSLSHPCAAVAQKSENSCTAALYQLQSVGPGSVYCPGVRAKLGQATMLLPHDVASLLTWQPEQGKAAGLYAGGSYHAGSRTALRTAKSQADHHQEWLWSPQSPWTQSEGMAS